MRRAPEADQADRVETIPPVHDVLGHLAITCIVLFAGALGAGLLPLSLRVSDAQLRNMTALGAGLLIGAALAVVVPEGFDAFGDAQQDADMALPHQLPGLSLSGGFLVMLLLDQLQTRLLGGHAHPHSTPPHDHLSDAEDGLCAHGEHGMASPTSTAAKEVNQKSAAAAKALLGLLVHSAADGLAVGAASVGTSRALKLTVALAMLLHKAPVAFGLTTVFLTAKWPWARIRRSVLTFAAAAPLAAALTFLAISVTPSLASPSAIALCIIFSAGTFLYAACLHILPEVLSRHGQLTGPQLGAVVAGMLIPLLLSFAHSH